MKEIEILRQKLRNKEEIKIKNDIEYSYIVGQAVFYIQERKKAKQTQDYINMFLVQKTAKGIINTLTKEKRMIKSKTNPYLDYILKEIERYQDFKKIDDGMMIAGYLGENLIRHVKE